MAWGKSKYKELGPRYSDYRGEYRVWINMKRRCYNKKSDMYQSYGGRATKEEALEKALLRRFKKEVA